MKVVVTGGSGFFGSGIVARLRQAGHVVVSASRGGEGGERVDVADARSSRALFEANPGTDAVVHAAALAHVPASPSAAARCEAVNVEGTRNIAAAAAAAGVRRFVFISSVTVYGDYDLPPTVTEDTPAGSTSLYGSAKRRAEEILRTFGSMDLWVLRLSTMYAPEWLFNIRKRVSPPVIGRYVYFALDPNGRRYTLCSRRNGAEAVRWAVEARMPPGTYNVSEQHVYTQSEILTAVERLEGVKPHLTVPLLLPRAALAFAKMMPSASMRENAQSRYWKFCERNVFSSDKLASHGLRLPPDLLDAVAERS